VCVSGVWSMLLSSLRLLATTDRLTPRSIWHLSPDVRTHLPPPFRRHFSRQICTPLDLRARSKMYVTGQRRRPTTRSENPRINGRCRSRRRRGGAVVLCPSADVVRFQRYGINAKCMLTSALTCTDHSDRCWRVARPNVYRTAAAGFHSIFFYFVFFSHYCAPRGKMFRKLTETWW